MASGQAARVWSAVEARDKFDRLLAAAENLPQYIEGNGRLFVVTVLPGGMPAREVLARGGPLEEDDRYER
ncbi:hypothetical protein EJC49_23045 [Aquibium carbonis]|uniref:Uncharacterized protein n=1 Tax=Aquibium carbonis TaxID=2495581 RepID=A0A3R9YN77_9HYPH|nr:hypothetical protein [Aquibium carbonis]RST83075.1 hypothetical protein EJC49_23045 [Aquibium carbonis]